ncbi:hypothetical protein [Massilia rubra]|uniref:Uncharacterized protein n=1 Tax=Massilia rubra TaxID=2607910 RepID=A0ABX0M151_9BURK|nr:hypothetical protein [Massilia rubra]NHZ38057.1 hypothetical protein [Massilia rubra]
MEPKVQAIAKRFAEYVVGAMLDRSGADFICGRPVLAGNADFLVRNGKKLLAIHVRHTTDPKNASKVMAQWRDSMAGDAPALAKIQNDDVYEPHLVIVAGAGETVFADDETAPFLAPDKRTALSVLTPTTSMRKRA